MKNILQSLSKLRNRNFLKCLVLSSLFISSANLCLCQTVQTSTYVSGNIESDRSFTFLPGASTCFGSMSFAVPSGEQIYQVDVSYDMTASSGAWLSEQRTWLYSPSIGAGEATITNGFGGSTSGTSSYSRTITFANGFSGATFDLELHVGRTWGGSACQSGYNYIENGTWIVTVYSASCIPPSNIQATAIDNDTAQISWTPGGMEVSWNVEYGTSINTPGNNEGITSNELIPSKLLTALSPITSYDVYVQGVCPSDSSSWIGPFNFTTEPNCPAPTAFTVTHLSNDSVSVSWTGTGSESSFDVSYTSPSGDPFSGTISNHTSTTNIITNVPIGSYLDFYVRSQCGGPDSGNWVGPVSILTPCELSNPVTLPFSEDFENIGDLEIFGDQLVWCSPEYSIEFKTTDQLRGRLRLGNQAESVSTGTGAATLDVSPSGSNATNELILTIDMSSYQISDNIFLSFDWTEYGDEVNPGDRVWVRGSKTDVWLEIYDWSSQNPGTGNWVNASQLFVSTLLQANAQSFSSSFQIKFGQEDNFPTPSDGFGVDNIVLEVISCPAPTNLSLLQLAQDTAVIEWTNGLSESEWLIEFDTYGFSQGSSGVLQNSSSNPDTIFNLNNNTIIDVYVQALCSNGDSSSWIGPLTISTPIENDSTCGSILIPVDGQSRIFSNVNATNISGEPGGTNSSLWFRTIIPNSGHLAIGTCDSEIDTELEIFTYSTCSDYLNFTSIGYTDFNPWNCGGPHSAGIELCGLSPGDTIMFQVGSYSSSDLGIIQLKIWDLELEAGNASKLSACYTDTVNLWNYINDYNNSSGLWEYPYNPAAIEDDSLFICQATTISGNMVYYKLSNSCMSDSVAVEIDIKTNPEAGLDGVINACKNEQIDLLSGLSSNAELGGTWYDGNGDILNSTMVNTGDGLSIPAFSYIVSNGLCPDDSSLIEIDVDLDCDYLSQEEFVKPSLILSPNPVRDILYIDYVGESTPIELSILDLNGREVKNIYFSNAQDMTLIDFTELEKGVYLLKMKQGKNFISQRVVKI